MSAFNALIRTHHITSRKKIARIKQEAQHGAHYVLLRTNATPGLMYAEGPADGVGSWVRLVKSLNYKDLHVVCRPAPMQFDSASAAAAADLKPGFEEESSLKAFAAQMERRGILAWWLHAMGFTK